MDHAITIGDLPPLTFWGAHAIPIFLAIGRWFS